MAEQDSDLTEEASDYKLDKAREKGSVAKSPDLIVAAILMAMAVVVHVGGWGGVRRGMQLQQNALAGLGRQRWSADDMAMWMGKLCLIALDILIPLFAAIAICAILGSLFQTGPLLTFKPLAPDLDKINPATGLKRLFSKRILYETAKSLVKLVVLGAVAYKSIGAAIPGLRGLGNAPTKSYARILLDMTGVLLIKLAFALLVIALIDYAYSRWEFSKRMRMSKRDVREEAKNRDGDPRVRARLRELRQEALKRSKAMHKLPSADVLITNPTHLAVALSYKAGEASAPKVVAKGTGELARHMREVASAHRIPIIENKPLARALFRKVDNDFFVPEEFYPQLAKIMVWVYQRRTAAVSQ